MSFTATVVVSALNGLRGACVVNIDHSSAPLVVLFLTWTRTLQEQSMSELAFVSLTCARAFNLWRVWPENQVTDCLNKMSEGPTYCNQLRHRALIVCDD